MKRILLVVAVVIAMFSMLCVGLALGIIFTPVKVEIAQRIGRVLNRVDTNFQVEPRNILREPEVQAFQTEEQAGILIAGVAADSPAEQAGLRRGDILLTLDGEPVNNFLALQAALRAYEPGDEVELLVQRGDEEVTLTAALVESSQGRLRDGEPVLFLGILPCGAGLHEMIPPSRIQPWLENGEPFLPGMPHDIFPGGELDPEMLRTGALIREVAADSPAETAGLQIGQVIQAVDGAQLGEPRELAEAIASREPGDTVTLTIFDPNEEDGQTREVEVTLGENPDEPDAAWLGIRFVYLNIERLNPQNLPER